MKFRRSIILLLCALLLVPAGVGASAAEAELGGFVENIISLPEGYDSYTSPVVKADGTVVMAGGYSETGKWDLFTWKDINQAPTITPLDVEMASFSSFDVAPDGGIMAVSNLLGGMRRVGGANSSSDSASAGGAPGEQTGTFTISDDGTPPEGENGEDAKTQAEGDSQPEKVAEPVIQMGNIEDMKSTVYWFSEDGSVSAQFEISGIVTTAKAMSGQKLANAGVMQGGVDIYDSTGNLERSIPVSNPRSLLVTESSIIYADAMTSGKLYEIDAETGDAIRTINVSSNSAQITAAPDGTIYLVDSLGITKIEPGATEGKQLVQNPTDYLIGNPGNSISGCSVMPDGSIIAKIVEGEGSAGGEAGIAIRIGGPDTSGESTRLALYIYRPDLDLSNRIPFTISALRNDTKMRKAVSEFQRLHPELIVTYEPLLSETDTDTPVDDAIRTFNTDLLSGKGGDVLILDGMPISKYIEKGVLMDLTEVLSGIDFLPGILEGSKSTDGKLYAMPAFFNVYTIWGNQNKLEGVGDLSGLSQIPLDQGQTLITPRTIEDWINFTFPASEAAFRDESGNLHFDTPEFERYLEELYTMYSEQGPIQEEETGGRIGGVDMQMLINGAAALYPMSVNSTMQLSMAYTITGKEESAFITVPSIDGNGTTFAPSVLAGINAQSVNKELAAEFIRTLYAPDMQEIDQMAGLPVVAASLDKLVEDGKERSRDAQSGRMTMSVMVSGGGSPFEIAQPDEATWDNIRELMDTLDTSYVTDDVLMGFIIEETAPFFEGYKSAQETAQAVQQRAWSYLNE